MNQSEIKEIGYSFCNSTEVKIMNENEQNLISQKETLANVVESLNHFREIMSFDHDFSTCTISYQNFLGFRSGMFIFKIVSIKPRKTA